MRFRTTILQSGKTATGIEVPDEVMEALGSGKRPAVTVTVNGYSYRSTVATVGGRSMVGLSAEHRAGAGVAGGDEVEVDVELDTAPREVAVPDGESRWRMPVCSPLQRWRRHGRNSPVRPGRRPPAAPGGNPGGVVAAGHQVPELGGHAGVEGRDDHAAPVHVGDELAGATFGPDAVAVHAADRRWRRESPVARMSPVTLP
jgi:hypothetical protein